MTESELESYLETHYEVVSFLEHTLRDEQTKLSNYYAEGGMGSMWELAKSITDDFEDLYKDREWDGEWLETLEEYVALRLNQL